VIECYDISHIQGSDTVASMVVFVDGVAARKRYRSFKIRGLDGLAQGTRQNDDFASMAEVLGRRLRRGLAHAASPEAGLEIGARAPRTAATAGPSRTCSSSTAARASSAACWR
jgi:excinuclease UvrABC nuclease subunit